MSCPRYGYLIDQITEPSLHHVAVCDGMLEDETPCLEELQVTYRFCPKCGKKVDQGLFHVTETATIKALPEKVDPVERATLKESKLRAPVVEASNADDADASYVHGRHLKESDKPAECHLESEEDYYNNGKNCNAGHITPTYDGALTKGDPSDNENKIEVDSTATNKISVKNEDSRNGKDSKDRSVTASIYADLPKEDSSDDKCSNKNDTTESIDNDEQNYESKKNNNMRERDNNSENDTSVPLENFREKTKSNIRDNNSANDDDLTKEQSRNGKYSCEEDITTSINTLVPKVDVGICNEEDTKAANVTYLQNITPANDTDSPNDESMRNSAISEKDSIADNETSLSAEYSGEKVTSNEWDNTKSTDKDLTKEESSEGKYCSDGAISSQFDTAASTKHSDVYTDSNEVISKAVNDRVMPDENSGEDSNCSESDLTAVNDNDEKREESRKGTIFDKRATAASIETSSTMEIISNKNDSEERDFSASHVTDLLNVDSSSHTYSDQSYLAAASATAVTTDYCYRAKHSNEESITAEIEIAVLKGVSIGSKDSSEGEITTAGVSISSKDSSEGHIITTNEVNVPKEDDSKVKVCTEGGDHTAENANDVLMTDSCRDTGKEIGIAVANVTQMPTNDYSKSKENIEEHATLKNRSEFDKEANDAGMAPADTDEPENDKSMSVKAIVSSIEAIKTPDKINPTNETEAEYRFKHSTLPSTDRKIHDACFKTNADIDSQKVEKEERSIRKEENINQSANLQRESKKQYRGDPNKQETVSVGMGIEIKSGWSAKTETEIKSPDSDKRLPTRPSLARYKAEATMVVHFHVLVSEDFDFVTKNKQLALQANIDGEWKEVRFQNFSLITNQTYGILSVEIPRTLITAVCGMQYKYCVISHGKNKSEYYKSRGGSRNLTIPHDSKAQDELHQYDGYIEREETWTIVKVKKAIQHLWNSRIKSSVDIYCTDIWCRMRKELCIREGLDQIYTMITCLERVYYQDNTSWHYLKNCKREIEESLVSTIFRLLDETLESRSTESEMQAQTRLLMSLAALCIVKSVDRNIPEKNSQRLCDALMMKPSPGIKQCLELQLAERYFKRMKTQLTDAFLWLIERMVKQSENAKWLNLVPWIHFLSDMIQPYQELEVDLGHADPKPHWWGTTDQLQSYVYMFRDQLRGRDMPVAQIIDHLQPLFEMDFKLPRTLMTLVDLRVLQKAIETKKIPVEISIASLIYHLKTTRPTSQYYEMYTDADNYGSAKIVQRCALSLLEQLQECFCWDSEIGARWEMCSEFSSTLLRESTQSNRRTTVLWCVQITLHCHSMHHRVKGDLDVDGGIAKVYNLAELTKNWIRCVINRWSENKLEENLQVWDGIFAPKELQSEEVRDVWNKDMTEELISTLDREVESPNWNSAFLIKLYCEKTDKYHALVQDCLSKIAFKTVYKAYAVDYRLMGHDAVKRFGDLLSEMFNTEWTTSVATDDTYQEDLVREKILRHVLHWTPFLQFIKISGNDQDKKRLFNKECIKRIGKAAKVVDIFVNALLDGSITVGMLDLISSPENRFDVIAEHALPGKRRTADFLKKAIAVRKREIEAFDVQAKHMTILSSLCAHIGNVDIQEVNQIVEKWKTRENRCLNEFCNPAQISEVTDEKTFAPVFHAFPVAVEVSRALPQINVCNQSRTFLFMWQKMARKIETKPLTLEQAVAAVWKPVKQKYVRGVSKQFVDNSIYEQSDVAI